MSKLTKYSDYKAENLFSEFGTSLKGLSSKKAQDLLNIYGPNKIKITKNSLLEILLRQLKSPFIYLLIIASLMSLFLGEKIDGIMILIFLLLNTGLGFYQEHRSEKTISLLNKYLTSTAIVIRENQEIKLETTNLVPGDIIKLKPGDIVPADIRLLNSSNLTLNESILTGESLPVVKNEKTVNNICFSGTAVVSGEALALVIETGKSTNYGKIAELAFQSKRQSTFEKQINTFSRFTLTIVLLTLLLLIITSLIIKESPSFIELAIFSIALAVSVIPEALPVVTTFSLSIGALKLAKKNVVVKRLSAIEDLGSIEVLCSDKTGTLTESKLTVDEILSNDKEKTRFFAYLLSDEPFKQALFKTLTIEEKGEIKHIKIIKEIPFDPQRKRVTKLLSYGKDYFLICFGAYEELLSFVKPIPKNYQKEINDWIFSKGVKGNRVLGLSYLKVTDKNIDLIKWENESSLLGLISFVDPIKPTAHSAVAQAKQLGVKIKILTGDSQEVASSVALKINLIKSNSEVINGKEFNNLTTEQKHTAVDKYSVFARVTPQDKYEIIKLLEEKYEVGFLGEGINDAPALKIANVALVVQSASDIAKESSDIILLKKSLHVIIEGIEEGRKVFANTTKYITATLSANFGNFFAVSAASLFIDFLPMLPIQILLVNLLSDFPMIAVATDNVDKEILVKPVRFDLKNFAVVMILLGLVSTIFDFIFFGFFVRISAQVLQTAWYMGSILTELLFLFSIRTKLYFFKSVKPSNPLIYLTLIAFLITILIPYTSWGVKLFSFQPLSQSQLISVLIIVFAYFTVTELVKIFYYQINKNNK